MDRTFDNFRVELNDLKPEIKDKAIELANDFMASGEYSEESKAIKEGIRQAEEWFLNLEG
jgi:uncharacterized protein YdaT